MFQAEVYAILQAMQEMIGEVKPPSLDSGRVTPKIIFFVDNQAALLALRSRLTKSMTVTTCVSVLNTLGEEFPIELRWVKAHVGIQGNEDADQAAKLGARGLPVKMLGCLPAIRQSI